MRFAIDTYVPGNSVIHKADPRVKLVVLAAYSVMLFCLSSWWGLLVGAVALGVVFATAKLPIGVVAAPCKPVLVLLGFVLLFNSFAFDVSSVYAPVGIADVSAGVLEGMPPIALIGTFGFLPEGFAHGAFYVLRIFLLLVAGFTITYTTTTSEITRSLASFMRPLRRLRVPVDDIAMVVSIALRFIPVTVEEFDRIHAAQSARGAGFENGGLLTKLKAWQTVLIPLFVGMFRRADRLAVAMDARCYSSRERSCLYETNFTAKSGFVLVLCLIACVAAGIVF